MFTFRTAVLAGCLTVAAASAGAQDTPYGFGRSATPEEVIALDTDVRFDGAGLPPGRGTVPEGKVLYEEQCAACHGLDLKGIKEAGARGFVGPGMTVQKHWPFAPTLFDYIKRAMPFTAPASLNEDQVYALTAYILSVAGIVTVETVMDAATLAAVEMPNRDGFVPDPRPDMPAHP